MKQKGDFQIPRNSLYWLLTAQFLVILPQMARLPIWILGVVVVAGAWRLMIFQGRWSWPPTSVKVLMLIVAIGTLAFQYRHMIGLEPMVALLVTTFSLKLLETRQQRDAFVVIMLGYFIITTEFLFDQSIPVAIYMAFVFVVLTAAMIGLNQTRSHIKPGKTFRLAGLLALQSIPVMLVLFLLFPRVTPLWAIHVDRAKAKTGMSDEMSPGDFAALGQSGAVAFRATFDGEIPAKQLLYFRGLTMSEFDGRTWRRSGKEKYQAFNADWSGGSASKFNQRFTQLGSPLEYEIIMEPNGREWLFALGIPESSQANIGLSADGLLLPRHPIEAKMSFKVQSWLDYVLEPDLAQADRLMATRIPPGSNPKTAEFARELRAEQPDDQAFISAVLTHFNQQEFFYTLRPPKLGRHPMDEFLFTTRKGFCEHYAGAFAFMMRSVGIPARIMAGYQGGEVSADGAYLIVRDSDAHAWVEVWLPEKGWVQFDPTGAVAPERIEMGLEFATEEEVSEFSPLSPVRYRNIQLLDQLRLRMDLLNYYWSRFVLNYNRDSQEDLLNRWLGGINWERTVTIMFLIVLGIYVITALSLLRKRVRKRVDPTTMAYQRFCSKLESMGMPRNFGEGPMDYANRAIAKLPAYREQIALITRDYLGLAYETPNGPTAIPRSDPRLARMRENIRTLKSPKK